MPTTYPAELKVKTIRRYEKGESIKVLSQELHISQSTLCQWRKPYIARLPQQDKSRISIKWFEKRDSFSNDDEAKKKQILTFRVVCGMMKKGGITNAII